MAGGSEYSPLDWIAPTQQVAAQVLGIDRRTLQDYIARGCDCKTSAGYSIPHLIAWAKVNVWPNRTNVGKPGGDDADGSAMDKAELRCKQADAAIKEAKAEQLLNTLVDRETVQGAISSLLNSIRHRLQACPEEVAGVIPPEYRADVTLDLSDKIAMILTEMAAWADSQNQAAIYSNEPETSDSFGDPAKPCDLSADPG